MQRKLRLCPALVLATGLCATGMAHAGEYQLRLGLDQAAMYDDNVDFTRTAETGATSYVLTPQASLDGKTERWDLGIDLALPFERYTEERLNSDNQDLQIVSTRRLERGQLDLSGGVLRDSTHRSEAESSGLVGRQAQRRVLDTFSGTWTRKLGDRDELSFGGSGQTADYAAESSLHDYGYASLQAGWTRVLNQRTSLQVTPFYSRLRSEVDPVVPCVSFFCFPPAVPLPDSETDTAGVQAGFTRVFNERLRGIFLFGGRHVKTVNHQAQPDHTFVEFSDSSNGGLATLGVTYTGERFEASAVLSEDVTPSGIGVLFERTKLLADLAYRVRESLRVRLHAEAYNNDSLDATVPFSRKFYGLKPHMDWRFRQNWSLLGGFDFRRQELESDSDPAVSNAVFLAINYSSEPLPVFR